MKRYVVNFLLIITYKVVDNKLYKPFVNLYCLSLKVCTLGISLVPQYYSRHESKSLWTPFSSELFYEFLLSFT